MPSASAAPTLPAAFSCRAATVSEPSASANSATAIERPGDAGSRVRRREIAVDRPVEEVAEDEAGEGGARRRSW